MCNSISVGQDPQLNGMDSACTSFSPELSWLEWEEVQVLLEVGRGVFFLSVTSWSLFR